MKSKPVTYGQLIALLRSFGYKRKVYDEHWVIYSSKPLDSLFILPNVPLKTAARERDIVHIRSQLHWRGLMERTDFDARYGKWAPSTS